MLRWAGPFAADPVNTRALHRPLRILSNVVLAAMAAVLIYAGYISLANWAHIAV